LSGLALTGAGLVVYVIESQRLEESVNTNIKQEIAEFERRQKRGDPDTGITYDSAINLMTAALRSNVPSEDEVIVAMWGGEFQLEQPGELSELVANPDFPVERDQHGCIRRSPRHRHRLWPGPRRGETG